MKVYFLPKTDNNIPAQVCNWKWGKRAAFNVSTDLFSDYVFEMYAMRHNIHITVFNPFVQSGGNLYSSQREAEDLGKLTFQLYYQAGYWFNPYTDTFENIPNYSSTSWTQAGADAFGVNVGDSKPKIYPKFGQDMYDLTNGALGYDFVNEVMGASNLKEFLGKRDFYNIHFQEIFDRKFNALSYQAGRDYDKKLMYRFCSICRNSNISADTTADNVFTSVGDGLGNGTLAKNEIRPNFTSRDNSSRFIDMYTSAIYNLGFNSQDEVLYYCLNQWQLTFNNGGFYNDFGHIKKSLCDRDPVRCEGIIDDFWGGIRNIDPNNEAWYGDYGEIASYVLAKNMIHKIGAFEDNGNVFLSAVFEDLFAEFDHLGINQGVPSELLDTEISLEIDLSNTSLAGKDITTSKGYVISKGNNIYIITTPVSSLQEFEMFQISETTSPSYADTSIPIIIREQRIDANTVEVETNVPTRAAAYKYDVDERDAIIFERSNTLQTVHSFTQDNTQKVKIGVVTEFKQSNLTNEIS